MAQERIGLKKDARVLFVKNNYEKIILCHRLGVNCRVIRFGFVGHRMLFVIFLSSFLVACFLCRFCGLCLLFVCFLEACLLFIGLGFREFSLGLTFRFRVLIIFVLAMLRNVSRRLVIRLLIAWLFREVCPSFLTKATFFTTIFRSFSSLRSQCSCREAHFRSYYIFPTAIPKVV
mgnify:CR=1 FL=1